MMFQIGDLVECLEDSTMQYDGYFQDSVRYPGQIVMIHDEEELRYYRYNHRFYRKIKL